MPGFVTDEQVFIGVEASTREEGLRFIANKGVELGFATDADAVYEAFMAREAEAETGLMEGYAVPHAKTEAIGEAGLVVVKFAEKLEWPSFDKQPVDIALALFVPAGEAGTTHLKLLSKSAVMLMDEQFRATVRSSDDAAEIAAVIDAGLDK